MGALDLTKDGPIEPSVPEGTFIDTRSSECGALESSAPHTSSLKVGTLETGIPEVGF